MTRDEEAAHDFEYGPIPSDIEAMMRAAGFSHSDGYEEWGHVQGSHGALRRLVAAVAAAEPIKPEALLADAPECTTAIIVEQCKCGLLAVGYVAELRAEVERLREALEVMTAEFDRGDATAYNWAAIRKARNTLKETK
jgi:hypothetical protein